MAQLKKLNGGSPVQWLREETREREVVSLKPSAAYQKDRFSHLFVAKWDQLQQLARYSDTCPKLIFRKKVANFCLSLFTIFDENKLA